MKVIFFGSSDYCLPILQSLFTSFNLVCVVTKPDQPVGKHKILTPTPIKKFAHQYNIPVFTPKNKSELLNLKSDFQHLNADIAIVADYGTIIPIEIFQIPKNHTLNIHFSELPKFRGPSPVQYTILFGENIAWISIIIMDHGLDTGNIIWHKEIKLSGGENTQDLYKKLFNIAAEELPDIIIKYINNELILQKQDHSKATYTRQLTMEDGFVPWEILITATNGTNPSKQIISEWPLYRQLKGTPHSTARGPLAELINRVLLAFTPWPGLWTIVKITNTINTKTGSVNDTSGVAGIQGLPRGGGIKKRLKILKAHLLENKLILDQVQLEGKKPVFWKQFLEGYPGILSR